MRTRIVALATALLLAPATVASTGAAQAAPGSGTAGPTPDRIELPRGWQPEGITTDGQKLYVGSLATGAILRANPRTGTTSVLPRSATGKPAVGVEADRRRGVIWVAGGEAGEIRAQSAASGRVLATYPLPTAMRFVNDLVVTRDAVYATDSMNQELAVVRLDGKQVPASGPAELLPLTGDLVYGAGFNANGIVASGGYLVLVQSAKGLLFRVDPLTGDTEQIDLGGYLVTNGDGLEIDGDRLYVVRNRDNLIAVVDLAADLLSREVTDELTSDDVDVPTTVALLRGSLYAVNARFGNPSPATADYWITRLDAPRG
ncbi:superoxide dismutase [Nocardioides sp. HDW12B]|uniref:superoxide dismutase n=1 Tax=Nocardioides sp. HDW12B TaxID=2714939 RepID=UPI00140B56CB|nr:superoxide dismutase [Nocardioides sp. HDW12B]QIK66131.1 superoxide dismutase [Nocardioides sp. HDW12B]